MHPCPACSYRLDALPGVPRVQFGEFSQDVVCPECGFVIRKGQRVVVGSTVAAAVGARVKFSQYAVLVPVVVFGLTWSIRGLYAKAKVFSAGGGWSPSWQDLAAVGVIAGIPAIVVSVYRMMFAVKFQAKPGVELILRSNSAWIIAPGELRLMRGDKWGDPSEPSAVLVASEIRTIRAIDLPRQALSSGRPMQLAVYRDAEKERPHTIHVSAMCVADELATSLLASVRREMRADELRAREAAVMRAGEPIVVRGVPFVPLVVGDVSSPTRGRWGGAIRIAGPAIGMAIFFAIAMGGSWRIGVPWASLSFALVTFLVFCLSASHIRIVAREKRSGRATWTCSPDGLVIVTNPRRFLFKRRETKRFSPQAVRSIDVRMKQGAAYLELCSVHEREPVAVIHPDDWSGWAPDTLAQAMREALGHSSPATALHATASPATISSERGSEVQ